MTFLFFNAADTVLFSRDDAEQAEHNHQEMGLFALFPFVDGKRIAEGMRVGYTDDLGVFQVFEIIKVITHEPDHYQEITGEHICIPELTDEIYTGGDMYDVTASEALQALLNGTLWQVGNVSAANVSSATFGIGDVWRDVRSIEQNWNVYITPRITCSETAITGRYLDIAPASPVWRGLRFSLEKNLDDASVTWDTSRLKTALYGYGKNSMTVSGQSERQPWTFADVTWEATDEHPAKPAGQIYIEDPEATAAYGRNGRPRFGYYQNGDVEDPEKLLELTWETLKTVSTPDVTIEGQVRDITKFGAVDVPIRLHDSAQIEITPIGTVLVREVTQYNENLLTPENSQITIGKYIPNIVYITKEVAHGGGGGGGSGGDTDTEYQIKEFETALGWNDYQISLKAWQRDLDKTDENLLLAYAAIGISSSQIQSIVTGSGVQLDPDTGNIVVDSNGLPVFAAGSSQMWSDIAQSKEDITTLVTKTGVNSLGQSETLYSKIQQNATEITTKVSAGDIASTINQTAQSVLIQASKIDLQGYVTASDLSATNAQITNLTSGTTTATALRAGVLQANNGLFLGSTQADYRTISLGSIQSISVLSAMPSANKDFDHSHSITMSESSGVVTATLGAAVATTDAGRTANFNIADTQFYQDAVSAARSAGYTAGAAAVDFDSSSPVWGTTTTDNHNTITYGLTNGKTASHTVYVTVDSSWSNGSKYCRIRSGSTGGAQRARVQVSLPGTSEASWTWVNTAQGYWQAQCTIGGRTYSNTHHTG